MQAQEPRVEQLLSQMTLAEKMVDICRDPRWGRIAEGAGEDPFLGAAMARARVRGFQAGDLASGRRLVSCPKHYAAYGAAEGGKDYNTVDISERTLRDLFLPLFRAAFEEGAGTVMSAFNEIAGVPASANAFILDAILRREWGFQGVVLSDWNAIGELIPHGCAADLKEAAEQSVLAGVDMGMMADAYHHHLAEPGDFSVWVGHSAAGGLEGAFEVVE